ncbi:MAG TPA: DNA cytosine methyltransferase [Paraburkholderia sp.]
MERQLQDAAPHGSEESSALTYGSVCSGIEAASTAWESLGWRAAWFAEIEKFPVRVLEQLWADVPNLGDMTAIAAQVIAGSVPAPDVLVGGTPCQAFSIAGLRSGLSDQRGQLTLSFVQLANAIDTARSFRGKPPCVITWENVPGVLSTKDNAFGCFLGALAGEDVPLQPPGRKWSNAGYVLGPKRAVAWRTLNAEYFGIPQRRRRVFVIASARDGFDPGKVLFESEGVRRDSAPRRAEGQDAAAGTLRSTDGGCDVDHAIAGHIQAYGGGRTSGSLDVAACLTAKGQRLDFEVETFALQAVSVFDPLQITSAGNRSKPTPELCHTLPRKAEPPIAFGGVRVRRLMPVECERLQGFPDGHTAVTVRGKPAADGPRYKAIGNSMAVPVMRWIGRRIDAELRK